MSQLDELLTRIESMDIDESDDQIERLLTNLEAAGRLNGGPKLLVERFGSSSKTILLRSLSFVLARIATDNVAGSLPALIDFAEVVDTDDESTLINSISALKRHRFNSALDDTLQTRHIAWWRLIQACLNHPSKLVRFSTLEHLELLFHDGQLDRILTEPYLSQLTHTLADWRDSGEDDIAQEARTLLVAITQSVSSDKTTRREQ